MNGALAMSTEGSGRERPTSAMAVEYVQIAGLQRRVLSWGDSKDSDFVLLLCHGYGEHLERYRGLAERLAAERGYVLGVESPGHGCSAGAPGSLPSFEDVIDAMDVVLEERLRGLKVPLVVLGHSLGGLIATRYVQTAGRRVSGLVLTSPVLGDWSALNFLLAQDELPQKAVRSDLISTIPDEIAEYDRDPLIYRGGFDWPTVFEIRDALNAANSFDGPLDVPVLWMHGADDRMVKPADSRKGIERLEVQTKSLARCVIYENARHELLHDYPQARVIQEVRSFITDIQQSAAPEAKGMGNAY